MRRKGVAKQTFFRGFMKQTNKTSLQEMTQGHCIREPEWERHIENMKPSSCPLLDPFDLSLNTSKNLLSLYIPSLFSVDHEKILS